MAINWFHIDCREIGVDGSEFWERDIVENRADCDRLISIVSVYNNKPVMHVCRE